MFIERDEDAEMGWDVVPFLSFDPFSILDLSFDRSGRNPFSCELVNLGSIH